MDEKMGKAEDQFATWMREALASQDPEKVKAIMLERALGVLDRLKKRNRVESWEDWLGVECVPGGDPSEVVIRLIVKKYPESPEGRRMFAGLMGALEENENEKLSAP
jgi:hypothetical protein